MQPRGLGESLAVSRRSRSGVRAVAQSLFVSALLAFAAWVSPMNAVRAAADSSNSQGFDSCHLQGSTYVQPQASDMQTWWNSAPFWLNDFYVYLGGSTAYCQPGTSRVDGTWITQVRSQGWGLVGIWAGPQCCGGSGISTDPTTAYNQGRTEGVNVINQLTSWNQVNYGFPLVYDFEPYSASYTTAANAFISGWVKKLHDSGFISVGAYGSSCSSNATSWASAQYVPDFVWLAWYASPARNTAWGYLCIDDKYWNVDQLHGQYNGSHWQTINAIALYID